jgi:hypothetical protein
MKLIQKNIQENSKKFNISIYTINTDNESFININTNNFSININIEKSEILVVCGKNPLNKKELSFIEKINTEKLEIVFC